MLSVIMAVCLGASAVSNPAETSGDRLALEIQIEKLRMNVFEVRDIVVYERRLNAGFGAIGGLGLILHGSLTQQSELTGIAQQVTEVVIGVGALSISVPLLFARPDEYDLWDELERLRVAQKSSPAVFLAEAETLFEASVQKAMSSRHRAAIITMALGTAYFGIFGVAGGLLKEDHNTRVGAYVAGAAGVAAGVFYLLVYETPIERAWHAYMFDKNTAGAITLAPTLGAWRDACLVGVAGRF